MLKPKHLLLNSILLLHQPLADAKVNLIAECILLTSSCGFAGFCNVQIAFFSQVKNFLLQVFPLSFQGLDFTGELCIREGTEAVG